ncbi:MAG: class F sortase [Candidatus Pacebacteria bacterium]|nr:class F sortase [Candidatus Paceibacterota bacterium]
MQSSSAARLVGASVIAATTLACLPLPIVPARLAQNSFVPSSLVTAATTVEARAQTTNGTLSSSLTGMVGTSHVSASLTGKVQQATQSGTRLVIPGITLNDAIIPVGLTAGGAMAVPSGKSSNVGWYDGGPRPGAVGTAVLDAHVFAAFSKLKNVSVGDSIYVEENGQSLHFLVTATKLFALSQITSNDLFTPNASGRNLNLITCAGKLTADHSTYDHRLVIYATLVQ